MRCKKCGEELPERARFCYVCGAPVDEAPVPRRLEEPLDPLAAGAVPLVPLAPPPRAYSLEPRARRAAARGDLRTNLPAIRPQEPVVETPAPEPPAEEEPAKEEAAVEVVSETEPAAEPEVEKEEAQAPEKDEAPEPEQDEAQEPEKDETSGKDEAQEPESEQGDGAETAAEKVEAAKAAAKAAAVAAKDAAANATILLGKAKGGLATAGDQLKEGCRNVADDFEGSHVHPAALAGGIVVVALLVLTVLIGLGTSWIGPFALPDEDVPVVEPPSDGSIDPLPTEEDAAAAEAAEAAKPEARATVAEYSWEELSKISALIAEAPSDDEGVKIAAEYNLCAADGSLDGTQTKDLELADGTTVPVIVAGIRHDQKADGSGVAGVTFVARAPVGRQAFNPSGEVGSWESSPVRSWLNQSLMGELPEGLADLIVPVTKTSTAGDGSLRETSDSMWLLACSELIGTDYCRFDEGAQYRFFSDMGVHGESTYLAASEDYWWLRTVTSDLAWQSTVTPNGSPRSGRNPIYEYDIVPGFCL